MDNARFGQPIAAGSNLPSKSGIGRHAQSSNGSDSTISVIQKDTAEEAQQASIGNFNIYFVGVS